MPKPDTDRELRSLPTHLHWTPRCTHQNTAIAFDTQNTRMLWLPDGEKNSEDMFIRFDRIHERNRQTDRRTDGRTDGRTPHDDIGSAYAQHQAAKI